MSQKAKASNNESPEGRQSAIRIPTFRVEGAGPLLIYIPGLDGTGELLFKQSPSLARSYRVATFRLREDRSFTYRELTDDVAAISRDLGEQRATIIGESFGGTVALQFAIRYPHMVERLVVVNSFPRFRGRLRINLARRIARALPFRLTWLARAGAATLGLLADGVTAEDRSRFFKVIRTVKRDGYVRRLELIADLDIEASLSAIDVPVLFIAGERDLLVRSAREANRMAARIPNATVKIIKRAGHACLLSDRVRLADLIAEWRVQGKDAWSRDDLRSRLPPAR